MWPLILLLLSLFFLKLPRYQNNIHEVNVRTYLTYEYDPPVFSQNMKCILKVFPFFHYLFI